MARGKSAERNKQDVRDRRDVKFEVLGSKFRTFRPSAFRPPHQSRFSRQSRPSRFSNAAKDLVRGMLMYAVRGLKGGQLELTPDPL